jgi:hypothetical protein
MRKAWFLVAAVLAAGGAQAQEPAEATAGLEVGVRYWLSSGMTKRAHDASSFSPILANPTSVLEYDDMWASSVELHARKAFGEKWWVKGYLGLGRINTGTFTDQDFIILNGQKFFSETVSGMNGKLSYGTIDVGREVWRRGNTAFSLFAGYSQWNEHVTSYGLSSTTGGGSLGDSQPAVGNDLTWKAARLGGAMRAERGRTRYTAEVVLVPYASYRNEDSHFLRSAAVGSSSGALGPVPNVIGEGRGTGAQFEIELRRSYPQYLGLEFGLGLRYWTLSSTRGTQEQAGLNFPLVSLKSERLGGLFSITKAW